MKVTEFTAVLLLFKWSCVKPPSAKLDICLGQMLVRFVNAHLYSLKDGLKMHDLVKVI